MRQDRAAPADDACDALRNQRQVLNQHAGVDGHVVDALRSLLFDYFKHDFGIQIFHPLYARDCFVNRHRANRHWRVAQNRLADFMYVAAGGKVHHGVGTIVNGCVQLLQFFVDFRRDRRVSNIRVDLA